MISNDMKYYDVAIVGGGMVGALLALALADLPLKIALIEAKTYDQENTENFDARAIALSYSSQQILQTLGIWQAFVNHATAIHSIHVSEKSHFSHVRLAAADAQLPALGYVIEAQRLLSIFHQLLMVRPTIDYICPAYLENVQINVDGAHLTLQRAGELQQIQAQLLIAADGGHSKIRELLGIFADIKQTDKAALVANLLLKRDHCGIAHERFTMAGPIAMLPHGRHRCTTVLVDKQEAINVWQKKSDKDFLNSLQQLFGYQLGRFLQVGKRYIHNLQIVQVKQQVQERLIIMGNAAHTLLPIAAQGFNLSLRDIACLAQVISNALQKQEAFYTTETLREYVKWRATDQQLTTNFTNGLDTIFNASFPPLVIARNAGLMALANCQWAKRQLLKHMMGIAGKVPLLMRGRG